MRFDACFLSLEQVCILPIGSGESSDSSLVKVYSKLVKVSVDMLFLLCHECEKSLEI